MIQYFTYPYSKIADGSITNLYNGNLTGITKANCGLWKNPSADEYIGYIEGDNQTNIDNALTGFIKKTIDEVKTLVDSYWSGNPSPTNMAGTTGTWNSATTNGDG